MASVFNMIRKIIRLLNTLKYLKVRQLFYFILRRKFSSTLVRVPTVLPVANQLSLIAPIATSYRVESKNAIRFLNHNQSFELDAIDWCPVDMQRLWRYNLHYFDYLRDPAWSVEEKFSMINSWIANNKQSTQPGWEPFNCSLRLVNWFLFLNKNKQYMTSEVQHSVYEQALWLEHNDEQHILANHYFENLKALMFAGCFFSGGDSNEKNSHRWLKRSKHEILQQLKEQTLADGGHYERSPQYHVLMLENYLDIYNLAVSNRSFFDAVFISELKKYSVLGLNYLNDIVFPDNNIPLFNDSAFGISPSLEKLNQYAYQLFAYKCQEPTKSLTTIEKHDSGLYGLRSSDDMLLMDCGDIGPSYQPGHTHCDFLSYELMLGGKRLVVDTGVFEYEPGPLRHYVRSTQAHNTVSIDGDEQSEIWGEFRVARRAKKLDAQVCAVDEQVSITGAFCGFYGSPSCFYGVITGWKPRFKHQRDINVKLVKDAVESIEVVDTLSGKGEHEAESYIHIHPDFVLESIDEKNIKILLNGVIFAKLEINIDCQYRIKKTIYCPEFGVKHDIDCIVIYRQGFMPLNLGYRIQRFI